MTSLWGGEFLSETMEHRRIKARIYSLLANVAGAAITEYPSDGHRSDVFAVTKDGIRLFVEVVWTDSKNHFYRDMSLLQQSSAEIKVVVANPSILRDRHCSREYEKIRISELRRGCIISPMISANMILGDGSLPGFASMLKDMVSTCRKGRRAPAHFETIEKALKRNQVVRPDAFRQEGPLWIDFDAGVIVRRDEVAAIIEALGNSRTCVVKGGQASGKTTLLRAVGYELGRERVPVFFLDTSLLDVDKAIEDIRSWGHQEPVVILDNAHKKPEICSTLLGKTLDYNVRILLGTRLIENGILGRPEMTDFAHAYRNAISITVNKKLVSAIVKEYARNRHLNTRETRFDDVLGKCGGDLWVLACLLETWKGDTPLELVPMHEVYDKIYRERFSEWSRFDGVAAMLLISALSNAEIPCPAAYLHGRGMIDKAMKLVDRGEVSEADSKFWIHPSLAGLYLATAHEKDLLPRGRNKIEFQMEEARCIIRWKPKGVSSALVKGVLSLGLAKDSAQDITELLRQENELEEIGKSFFWLLDGADALDDQSVETYFMPDQEVRSIILGIDLVAKFREVGDLSRIVDVLGQFAVRSDMARELLFAASDAILAIVESEDELSRVNDLMSETKSIDKDWTEKAWINCSTHLGELMEETQDTLELERLLLIDVQASRQRLLRELRERIKGMVSADQLWIASTLCAIDSQSYETLGLERDFRVVFLAAFAQTIISIMGARVYIAARKSLRKNPRYDPLKNPESVIDWLAHALGKISARVIEKKIYENLRSCHLDIARNLQRRHKTSSS